MNTSPDAHRLAPARRDPARPLRYVLRTPVLLLHLLVSLPVTLLLINPLTARCRVGGERVDHLAIRAWSLGMMRIFGFRVRRVGTPLAGGAMFVANHVSWMDITLLHSQRVVGFVAKSEISRWPLIGWLARRGGTIYHRRGSNESLNGVLHQMVQRLQTAQAVGVFPEGGTTPGDSVRTFHARIFQAAVVAEVPVQPVALRYGDGGAAQTLIAFGPGENFLQNFVRVLGEPARVAEVHFLDPVHAGGDGRRRLAETCRERIVDAMQAR
jgi:1-acyl-sn-glycerol-3-phosphate acyltransferase